MIIAFHLYIEDTIPPCSGKVCHYFKCCCFVVNRFLDLSLSCSSYLCSSTKTRVFVGMNWFLSIFTGIQCDSKLENSYLFKNTFKKSRCAKYNDKWINWLDFIEAIWNFFFLYMVSLFSLQTNNSSLHWLSIYCTNSMQMRGIYYTNSMSVRVSIIPPFCRAEYWGSVRFKVTWLKMIEVGFESRVIGFRSYCS